MLVNGIFTDLFKTSAEPEQWIMGDLSDTFFISHIKIHNSLRNGMYL